MDLSTVGLFLQTVTAGLLALIFLYLSRGHGNRVLQAAAFGWLFLLFSMLSLLVSTELALPLGNLPYQYLKLLSLVALIVAADRMQHESSLGKPLRAVALFGAPLSFGIVFLASDGPRFQAIHAGLEAAAWLLVTFLIFRSRVEGLGKRFSGFLALLTALLHGTYATFSWLSLSQGPSTFRFLAFTGFYDVFLEMMFGIGLII